ncbi:MAG: glycerol kinase, partial [Clostridia bacterium]|jgi:glycerol kinase|nr:glycerol kinase [Clostridiales bacterium]MDK2986675.1 glycerol kinase [Clostridia bacterium]
MAKYLLALDQGTTSSRAILFNRKGEIIKQYNQEFKQIYPQPGWVEHDPEEIWETQLAVAQKVLKETGVQPEEVAAIGITNQRETTVIWDKNTGKPLYNAIVWQCRRTAAICNELREKGLAEPIRKKTGLVLDAYFSGTKIKWLLDNVEGLRKKAENGEVFCGTIDSWLIYKLTGGKVHATDYSNASRTMLYNIHELKWDEGILKKLDIPAKILPEVRPSSGDFGVTVKELFGAQIPIAGVAGDQQAALFGQCCFEEGMAKNTYGTGCFMLKNTGTEPVQSQNGLLTTIAWGMGDKVYYALEGSIFIAGAVVQWLRDELGMIKDAAESEELALKVEDTGGVYLVPAFVGLGAPHWDMYARGTMVGITRGTNKNHIVRAALEAITYQVKDVVQVMLEDSGLDLKKLRVDGGAVKNNFLMQFQSDMLQVPVERPQVNETTALGAAFLAGLGIGFYSDIREVEETWQLDKTFEPQMDELQMEEKYQGWKKAVDRAKGWVS